jgi:alpha-ketoglutarate-dependent taurine dioxygenase
MRAVSCDVPQTRVSAEVAANGFAFLNHWQPALPGDAAANELGAAISFGRTCAVHTVIPRDDAPPNTYSGIYGFKQFPMHSDMAHWAEPPRYLMLRCVKGYGTVPTLLIDGNRLIELVGRTTLSRAVVRPRRPRHGKLALLTLYRLQHRNRAPLLRWDEKFIIPASTAGALGMQALAEAIASFSPQVVALANPGDTLIIDNWRMLHGRASVPHNCSDRIVQRAYLGELH